MFINSVPQISNNRAEKYSVKKTTFKGNPVRISGVSAAASAAISAIAISLINIQKAFEKGKSAGNIDTDSLFIPLGEQQQKILEQIETVENTDNSFPEDLKEKMIEAVKNNNFDLKGVYNEYYSALNLCETLDEVKQLYPHLQFPDTPKTDNELAPPTTKDSVIIYYRKSYLSLGGSCILPLHILLRHCHKPEELKKADEIIKNKTNIINTESVLKAAEMVKTEKSLSETLDYILDVDDKYKPMYFNEKMLEGLLKTLSVFKPEEHKSIIDFYKLLIENRAKTQTQMVQKTDMIRDLVTGGYSYVANMATKLKNPDDLKKIFEIIQVWGLNDFTMEYPEKCIELYNISDNKDVITDLTKIFSPDAVKDITDIIKNNPNAKNILDNYKTYTDSKNINGLTLQCIFDELGLLNDEQGQKILAERLPKITKKHRGNKSIAKRFEGQNYDKSIIDALKQIHIDLVPFANVKVQISENDRCLASSLGKYRNTSWNLPNKDLQKVINNSGKIYETLTQINDELLKLNEEDYTKLAEIPAKRKYWADFQNYTRDEWFTVRHIKDRQYNEKSLYNTENLVMSYLYNLYQESIKNPDKKFRRNPLSRISNYPFLTKNSKKILDEAYRNIYNDRYSEAWKHFTGLKYSPEQIYERADFKRFCEENNFDKEAVAESLMKIEQLYHSKFYRMYHAKTGRAEQYKDNINEALEIIYEKLLLADKQHTKANGVTESDAQALLDELDGGSNSGTVDKEKLRKLKFISQTIVNNELKARCSACASDDNPDAAYFEYVYNLIQNSYETDKDGNKYLNEMKVLVILKLHDKFLENSDGQLSEEEFISNELKAYRLPENGSDYDAYYNDMKSELDFYTYINELEYNNDEEMARYTVNFKIKNPQFTYEEANKLIKDYLQIPEEVKSVIKQIINNSDKCYTPAALDEIKSSITMIKSWHMDKAEIIILNEAGINKKVIITKKAKDELWAKYNGNYKDFGSELKKYYKAANKYAPKEGMPGIKVFDDGSAELKLKGVGGGMRMYTREITEEDRKKYKIDENDTMPIKYIFDSYGDHT